MNVELWVPIPGTAVKLSVSGCMFDCILSVGVWIAVNRWEIIFIANNYDVVTSLL